MIYKVEERGYNKKFGYFYKEYFSSPDLQKAIDTFGEIAPDIIRADYFILKDIVDTDGFLEYETIAESGAVMPVIEIGSGNNWYEIFVSESDEDEDDELYSLNDFKVGDVAYDTAFAEIRDIPMFDEFGNLIKEIN